MATSTFIMARASKRNNHARKNRSKFYWKLSFGHIISLKIDSLSWNSCFHEKKKKEYNLADFSTFYRIMKTMKMSMSSLVNEEYQVWKSMRKIETWYQKICQYFYLSVSSHQRGRNAEGCNSLYKVHLLLDHARNENTSEYKSKQNL